MALREHRASGREYLSLVTTLLQQARRASPAGGVWEAADLQWWWRRDQHKDPTRQIFWLDDGVPVAAVILSDWGGRYVCEVMAADHDVAAMREIVVPRVVELVRTAGVGSVETTVRDDDRGWVDAIIATGFEATDEVGVENWMDARDRPDVPTLAAGFELVARSEVLATPHHMIPRNGDEVAERLAECSLYRPDLDLAIRAPNGDWAAYGLFWADPATGVGLVEPMRTEDGYQGMGLARHVLAAGLTRLAAAGCSRLKVTYLIDNEASRHLYASAGFRPAAASRSYCIS